VVPKFVLHIFGGNFFVKQNVCKQKEKFHKVKNDCLQPLCFVELFQNDCEFLALLDSGVQCNVVAQDVVDKWIM